MNFKKLEGPLNTSTNNHKAYAHTRVQTDQNRQKYLKINERKQTESQRNKRILTSPPSPFTNPSD